MQLRGHGNGVAIALAALAVVIAGTGTAVAVTAQVVNIADPNKPAQVARVDTSGRLRTTTPTSNISEVTFVNDNQILPLTDLTTATLAISSLSLLNPEANSNYQNTDFGASLVRILPGSSGTCYDHDITVSGVYAALNADVGNTDIDTYPAALTLGSDHEGSYCVGVSVYSTDNVDPTSYLTPTFTLAAYATNGTYTGIGASAHPSNATGLRLVTPAHPHGVTVTPKAATGGK